MIRHVVLMKFTDPEDAPEAAERLRALADAIDEIADLHVGLDMVGSEVSWHLVLTTLHRDLDALQGYQSHPVHQEFGAWVRPRLEARAAVDSEVDSGRLH